MDALIRLARWNALAAFAAGAFLGAGQAGAEDKVVMRINFTPWAMHAQYFGGRAPSRKRRHW